MIPEAKQVGLVRVHLVAGDGIGNLIPQHPHHLIPPFFLFLFMDLAGYVHAIDRCIWSHLRHSFGI